MTVAQNAEIESPYLSQFCLQIPSSGYCFGLCCSLVAMPVFVAAILNAVILGVFGRVRQPTDGELA